MVNLPETILSVCATTYGKIDELPIKNGQLIFIQDKQLIAFDYNGKRRKYSQIVELNTEQERKSILAPITGMYYFVLESGVLWTYQNGWIPINSVSFKIEGSITLQEFSFTDDGNENVTIMSPDMSFEDDGNGNVTITSSLRFINDNNGNITITI